MMVAWILVYRALSSVLTRIVSLKISSNRSSSISGVGKEMIVKLLSFPIIYSCVICLRRLRSLTLSVRWLSS